ncbi:putative PrpF protein [Acrodontium crateriforme]|uniref:PrpF protein n=1 Tax=Acrodontium crateriforme TaxID=150365 RepID=A0AAQ3R426_9PEZI|nr:putative PrpF protein [Acrodontium crateriforme]
MGSPDPYGRQLDGMGSGISSTSKICVVEKSNRDDADVDYTFVQIGIQGGDLDMAGNCGNMSSAVGPWAVDEGLVQADGDAQEITVRMFNTNTSKILFSSVKINPKTRKYDPFGSYSIDGVPGRCSRITLSFLNPEGAKTGAALPTGNGVDILHLSSGKTIHATLSDIANPGVFILATDLDGFAGDERPESIEANKDLMRHLEDIRRTGAAMMGLDPDIQSVPKIVILSRPTDEQANAGVNIVCRALSMQQAHKAAPLTLALNLGAACRIPQTLPSQIAVNMEGKDSVTIAHASGKLEVGSVMKDGKIQSALLHRTARILMKGDVFYSILNE